ncbi:hypothetical protein OS176_14285, partial [Xanthomonadaceae bacterium XH05]|nr:hypothetical protein [Xanthomonadaceae bacterium XH05]
LDKTGNKASLLDRLAKALIAEGQNPGETLIIPSGGSCRTAPKKPIDNSSMIEDALETEIQKEEFTTDFSDQETKNTNDTKDVKDTIDTIDTKDTKDTKDNEDNEDNKDNKDT